MLKRRNDANEYYEPAKNLHYSIKQTRQRFQEKANAALELIANETNQLRQIHEVNKQSIEELNRSAEYLKGMKSEPNDSPIRLAVRTVSSFLPFIAFGIIAFCART